jgi:hypothetical protein
METIKNAANAVGDKIKVHIIFLELSKRLNGKYNLV